MSAISLKSITGITSITTPTGVDDQLTLHNNNTTERVKIDTAGNVHINNHLAVTGVTTVSDKLVLDNSTNAGKDIEWQPSNNRLAFFTNVKSTFGNGANLEIYSTGTDGVVNAASGDIKIQKGGSGLLTFKSTGSHFLADVLIADSIIHDGDTNTKIRFPADDTFSVETGGVQRLQLNATEAFFNSTGADTDFRVSSPAQGHLFFVDAGNDQVTIKTSSAQSGAVLTVNGRTHLEQLTLGNNSTLDAGAQATIYKPATNNIAFATAGANERLRIDSVGNVKIGSGAPTDILDVHRDSTTVYDSTDDNAQRTHSASITIRNDNGSTNTFSQLVFDTAGSNQSIARIVALRTGSASNALTFVTEHSNTKAERLRITSDGKIGMGLVSTGASNTCDPDGNQLLIRGASTFQTNKGHIMLTGDSSTVGQGPQIVFSESGSGANWAGAYIGHVRQGGGSLGDLVFGTRETTGDASTVPDERLRITSVGDVLIGSSTNGGGNRLYVVDNFTDGFINPTDSVLRIENANTSGTTTQTSISFTSKTSGSNADSAIVSQAEDASGNARLEFWTDTSNGMTEKLVLSSTGKLSLTSNDGLFIRPTTDSQDAKITFSTNNNNSNSQIGHIKYQHQDNAVVSNYGEGMIMGGTESNGFALRVDGAINIKDSDSAGGDGAKLLLGTDKDMRIYHSGGDGFFDLTGSGGMRFRVNDLIFQNYTQSGTRRVRFHGNEGIEIYAHSNAPSGGIGIKMSDASDFSQYGSIRYEHTNNAIVNDGTDECFVIEGSENQTALKVDGRFYISDSKFVLKPTFSNFDNIPNGTNSSNDVGCMMKYNNESNGNSGVMSNSAVEPFIANRSGSDGIIMRIRHQGNTEGQITVSGGQVSYQNFMGAHKAQLVDHSKPDLLIGTVLEAVDQLATWKYASFSVGVGTSTTTKYIPYYGSKSDGETDTITFESNNYSATIKNYRDPMPETTKHVCVKVSDTVGSKSVFGVFYCWEEDTVIEREGGNAEYSWNDLDVAAIGNYFIRMLSGQTPDVCDYVESAGDGTA